MINHTSTNKKQHKIVNASKYQESVLPCSNKSVMNTTYTVGHNGGIIFFYPNLWNDFDND